MMPQYIYYQAMRKRFLRVEYMYGEKIYIKNLALEVPSSNCIIAIDYLPV